MDTVGHAEEMDNVSANARMDRMEEVEKALRVLKRRHDDDTKDLRKQINAGLAEIYIRLSRKWEKHKQRRYQPRKAAQLPRRGGGQDEVDDVLALPDSSVPREHSHPDMRRRPNQRSQDSSRDSNAPAHPAEAARQPTPAAQPTPTTQPRQSAPATANPRGTANSRDSAPPAGVHSDVKQILMQEMKLAPPPTDHNGQMSCGVRSPTTPTGQPPPPPGQPPDHILRQVRTCQANRDDRATATSTEPLSRCMAQPQRNPDTDGAAATPMEQLHTTNSSAKMARIPSATRIPSDTRRASGPHANSCFRPRWESRRPTQGLTAKKKARPAPRNVDIVSGRGTMAGTGSGAVSLQ